MNRPVFVHRNQTLLDRITKESNSSALVTTSMVQALQWITNAELELSGIFVSPDDTTFSAFRFLEITLAHRPAIPVFLFQPELSQNPDGAKRMMKNAHIRGVFQGSEPYETLVSQLPVNVQSADRRAKLPSDVPVTGYVAIPIQDFYTGTLYPYDVFVEENKKMKLFAEKDSVIKADYLGEAAKKKKYLYVKDEDVQKSKESVKAFHVGFIDDADIPDSWKTSEMMVSARNVLSEMKQSGMNEQLVEYAQTMLGDLFKLISKLEGRQGSISQMINQAKQCDRSVFCASYAMLVCKQMKFEKSATLEILGLASVLQDISLYQTPFGDLSDQLPKDMSREALTFYQNHPTQSADIVSQHTDVPQVTLQVVRQHHERKDRTGFPNKVGGPQLHPMAEILSLINSYYEISRELSDDAKAIEEIQKKVFPHYSDNVNAAFKQVLGNILKDKIQIAHGEQKGQL